MLYICNILCCTTPTDLNPWFSCRVKVRERVCLPHSGVACVRTHEKVVLVLCYKVHTANVPCKSKMWKWQEFGEDKFILQNSSGGTRAMFFNLTIISSFSNPMKMPILTSWAFTHFPPFWAVCTLHSAAVSKCTVSRLLPISSPAD